MAAIVDLYSRKVVGFASGKRCTTSLVLKALAMAVSLRHPAPGLIVHSDRGCQFTSRKWHAALKRLGIRPSMGRVGHCSDNAVIESFWASLKKERLSHWRWDTRREAQRAIRNYIHWFNTRRRHSFLAQLAPDRFEALRVA